MLHARTAAKRSISSARARPPRPPLLAKMPIDPELAHLVDQGRIEDFQGNWLDAVADKL